MPARSSSLSVALVLGTVVAGLSSRFGHLGLPPSVSKYSGSALWATMIYWLLSSLFPMSVPRAAMASSLLATAVELFKLIHTPSLDAFRLTLPGILLLGRFFSPLDVAVYCSAIFLAASADTILLRPGSSITDPARP